MPTTIQIYDPALCGPMRVCGPCVDPGRVAFAADVDWLVKNGVSVERYNLAQQPQAVVDNHYPLREQLAEWARVDMEQVCEARAGGDAAEKSRRCCS